MRNASEREYGIDASVFEARGLKMRRGMWMPHHVTYEPRLTNYPLSERIVISGASKSGWAHFATFSLSLTLCRVCRNSEEQELEGSSLSRPRLGGGQDQHLEGYA